MDTLTPEDRVRKIRTALEKGERSTADGHFAALLTQSTPSTERWLRRVIAMTPAFAYLTFSDEILYPTYEYAPRLIPNFSPQDDQLLAGAMMKIVGMAVALIVSEVNWSAKL